MGYSPGVASARAIEHIICTFLVRQSFLSLIATYRALLCRSQNRNDISVLFFQGFLMAAWLPPGCPSLACILFPLPAGGAEGEIWRTRTDGAADLTGTCCSGDRFCCALLTGRLKEVVRFMTTAKLSCFPAYSTSCFDLSGPEHS